MVAGTWSTWNPCKLWLFLLTNYFILSSVQHIIHSQQIIALFSLEQNLKHSRLTGQLKLAFRKFGGGVDKRGCDASFAARQLGVVIDEGRAVSVGGWRLSPFWWEAVFSDVTGLPSGLLPALVGGFDLRRWPCASWGRGY